MRLPRFGKRPNPEPQARLHPLMQAHYDPSLPYWVASDHAIWGTFDDAEAAITTAEAVAMVEPIGERVLVTFVGIGVYTTFGRNSATIRATSS